jgi:hypothetical protein
VVLLVQWTQCRSCCATICYITYYSVSHLVMIQVFCSCASWLSGRDLAAGCPRAGNGIAVLQKLRWEYALYLLIYARHTAHASQPAQRARRPENMRHAGALRPERLAGSHCPGRGSSNWRVLVPRSLQLVCALWDVENAALMRSNDASRTQHSCKACSD